MLDKETIRTLFREKIKRPLSFRDIVSLMGLNHKETRFLKRMLNTLVKSGELVLTRKGMYGPSDTMCLVRGYFEAHREGYGFVIMEKPGERDLFIPARSTGGAMNQDRVLVRIENSRRREGSIIRILERAHQKIAGKFEITQTGLYVKPKDRAIPFELPVALKDRAGARNGETVIAGIIDYPSGRKPPAAKILKILGKPEDPKTEIESIIDEFDLPRKFPRSVHEDANTLAKLKSYAPGPGQRRKDLRSLPTVTIDGERAKDFDDAVSIKISPHGYTLFVHIADVGFFVDWNTAVDLEARKRGTSVYFPDRVIPMLPKELSEDLCSLKPQEERLAVTVELEFDRVGTSLSSKFYPAVISSNERMTYTSVRKILIDNDRRERNRYNHLLQDLELMGELCGMLRNRRLERGSLDFDLPEPEVLLDMRGVPEAIIRAERNYAHMIIEEFMIAANEAVAEHLAALGIPSLYRIHEEPDPLKLDDITRVMKSVSPAKHPVRTTDFPDILRKVKGRPEEEIIHYMVLRSMKQARYSPVNVGHFGLASKCYTHFTSPIRRYPDLVVHRILREAIQRKNFSDKRIQELQQLLPDMAYHSSRMERHADQAENEVIAAMRAWFMKEKVGEEYDAIIVSITPYGLKVRLHDVYVEGFLHVSCLTDDFYQFDERQMRLIGRNTRRSFSIGNELRVRIDRVDMDEREIILDIAKIGKGFKDSRGRGFK
jgi:ribonuclease R